MKDGKNNVSLNLNLLNEKTSFEKLEETLKMSIFGVLYVLLKNQDFSVWIEIIFIILQLLQFMAFSFRPLFIKLWKQEESYTQVSNFLQYFQTVVFFQDNSDMYIIAFYICVCFVILVIINIVYVSISFSRNRFNLMWPLRVLRSVISFLVTVLFLPILELFISIFACVNKSQIIDTSTTSSSSLRYLVDSTIDSSTSGNLVNFYGSNIICWQGAHYIHVSFSILVSIAFIIICVIIQLTYFETKSSTHNQSAKSCSRSDVFMLVCKIILIILFGFFEQKSSEWVLIIVIFALSAFMFISYLEERPYYSDKIMMAYLVSTGVFFWNNTVLLIGKILEFSNFDGCLSLFFLVLPIVIALILTNFDNKLSILLTNINKFQKGEKFQKQISYFLELVDKKDFDRNSRVLLKGYIYLYEESCTFQDCALKKYIYSLENGIDTVAFLLQHTETLYQNGISKFPNCTSLRISYAFFLLERMNKKQQANLELLNTEKYSPKFEEQFIIFRSKKLIEEQTNELNDNEENLDVVSNIAYKNHFNQFKNCISKVATLYMDFWSLLLNPNQDNNEDLTKLNDYGSKINILVEEINLHFDKMQKLKYNDQEVIRYYSDFLNDILNDKEKAVTFKSRLNEIEGSKQTFDDGNYINIDTNALQSSDEYQYVILSALPEKLGIINNISLGICSMFGYSRTELIGKNIEVVIPEIFHKSHKIVLQEKINDFKKATLNIQAMRNFKPNFRDIASYGKNKSRYLVPFNFKVTLIPNNDQNDSFFLAKISQEIFNLGNNHIHQVSCILTNNSFIIQNFTANSINILGMNSTAMNNGNMEITRFIKEFREECLKYNLDLEEKTPEQIMYIKRQIASKFKNQTPITWVRTEDANSGNLKKSGGIESGPTLDIIDYQFTQIDTSKKNNEIRTLKSLEESLILSIQEIQFLGKQEGYVFKFEKNMLKHRETREFKDTITDNIKVNFMANNDISNLNIEQEITQHIPTPVRKKKSAIIQLDKRDNVNTITNENLNLKIDKSFIPDNNWTFQLDTKKMSYLVNPKNLNELRDAIKEEAIKKIKANEEHSETVSEESGSFSSYSRENYTSEESIVSSEKSEKRKNDEYYRINFNNFRFFIYDFKKNGLPEILDWQKESQLDFKKNEDYKKKDGMETKQDVGPNLENLESGEEENLTDNTGKEGILIKQIEYALSKEETQPTITRMKWISFFVFIVYLGIASLFLALFLNSFISIIENVSLIYRSYDILENTMFGVYHTRELVLLNNPKYTNIYQSRNEYIKNNTDFLLQLFSSSHDLSTSIITTFLVFTPSNDEILNNQTIYTSILQDDLSTKRFNLTLSSSFIETNSALYHVAHLNILDMIASNKDIFFYLYNSLNDVSVALIRHAHIYLDELSINSSGFKYLFLYIIIGEIMFSIIAYILISFAYMDVEKRKESYLEVFFEIGGATIKTSLEKCEYFTKKIQTESLSDGVSNLDEAELINENTIQAVNTSVKKSSSNKKRRTNNSKEARIIKIKVSLSLLVVNSFFLAVYLIYRSYLDRIEIFSDIYENTSLEQTQYLMIFNTLREYFFDRNSYVQSEQVSSYMDKELNNIYALKSDRESVSTKNKIYFPTEYADLYSNILNNNVCSYSTDFFETYLNPIDCTKFVSNSSSYGLNILLANYIEEIRYAKYKFDLFLYNSKNLNNYVYNNTLYGNQYNYTNNNQEYNKYDPFQIFNDPSHKNLVILNRYLIRPAYQALKSKLKDSINSSMNTFQTIYIVVFSVFLTSVCISYLFVWRPFEYSLNQTIYKTKNMLSIIPKEVLASLSNIHKLLDIGQNYSKGKRILK